MARLQIFIIVVIMLTEKRMNWPNTLVSTFGVLLENCFSGLPALTHTDYVTIGVTQVVSDEPVFAWTLQWSHSL